MSNKQQSSIKWLIEKFSSVLGKTYFTDEQNFLLIKYSEQAKAMHKEEMFEYIKQKYCIGHKSLEFHRLEFEQYYNETFGGNK